MSNLLKKVSKQAKQFMKAVPPQASEYKKRLADQTRDIEKKFKKKGETKMNRKIMEYAVKQVLLDKVLESLGIVPPRGRCVDPLVHFSQSDQEGRGTMHLFMIHKVA